MTSKIEDIEIYSGKFKGYRLGELTLTELKEFSQTQVYHTMNANIKTWVRNKSERRHHTRDFWDDWCRQAGVDDIGDDIEVFTYEIKHFNPDDTKQGFPVRSGHKRGNRSVIGKARRGVVAGRQ